MGPPFGGPAGGQPALMAQSSLSSSSLLSSSLLSSASSGSGSLVGSSGWGAVGVSIWCSFLGWWRGGSVRHRPGSFALGEGACAGVLVGGCAGGADAGVATEDSGD